MKTSQPFLDYLASCSEASLHAFELARLNEVANLHQELMQQIATTVDQIVEAKIQAGLAKWIGNRRRQPVEQSLRFEGRSRTVSETRCELPLAAAAQLAAHWPSRHHSARTPRVQKIPRASRSYASSHQLKLASAM